jgi:hypothetical protein
MSLRQEDHMSATDCKITSLEMVNGRTNQLGLTPIAFFSCDLRGIRIKGCQLMRTEKDGLTVWLPTFQAEKGVGGPHKSVTIIEDQLRHAVLTAARTAYRALGGTEAEWRPQ